MAGMAMARTVALVYFDPNERWQGKHIDVVEDGVVQTSASINVADGIS